MKEPKHTPPPWAYHPQSGYVFSEDMTVAEVRGWGDLTGHNGRALHDDEAREIQDSNGTLIATAPEMYGLLEEIARGPYDDSDCRSLCEAYVARARALLAKARGGDVDAAYEPHGRTALQPGRFPTQPHAWP